MTRLHRIGSGIVITACWIVMMGMSGMGTAAPVNGAVSLTDARVADTTGNEVVISSAVMDGKPLFQAYLGKGRVRIPFENISRVTIRDKTACVTLKGSRELCGLDIRENSQIHGKTPFGTYQIALKDVAWIEFTPTEK